MYGSSYAESKVIGRRARSFGGSQEATTQCTQFGLSCWNYLRLRNGSHRQGGCKQLRTTGWTVGFWRKRFNRGRLEALYDEPRVGAPRSISDQRVEEVISTTLRVG